MFPDSPCVGICKLDRATSYCLGCARTGSELAEWGRQSRDWQALIWQDLPARFQEIGVICRRLPWKGQAIQQFLLKTLTQGSGHWLLHVPGGETVDLLAPGTSCASIDKDSIRITAQQGVFQIMITEQIQALSFDAADTPYAEQRIILALKGGAGTKASAIQAPLNQAPLNQAQTAEQRQSPQNPMMLPRGYRALAAYYPPF